MTKSLETAAPELVAQGLRRVAIDPMSRVEGHGKVTLLLDAQNRVQQVRLHIVEFRGFEQFIQGRPYWEVPVMVQRLCGICPVSHHLAASKAFDRVVGAMPVTPTADKIRRLMHYGQVMQSHALHFFYLAAPDLLFGFDSDLNRRNIVGVAQAHPDIARKGVLLRKFGQEVIRATAGKRVHGTGSVPGGVNKHVSPADRALLARDVAQMLAWAQEAVAIAKQLHAQNPALYNTFGSFRSNLLSLVRLDGALDLYDGVLRARDTAGSMLFDGASDQDYLGLIEEEVKPWTYMKFPFLKSLGPDLGWYRVGPLARLQNCDFIPSPLAEIERREFVAWGRGAPVQATLAYHWARMVEMLHCVEVIQTLLDDPDILGGELMASGPRQRSGVGVIEAPRGTLFHHYEVGDDDLVTMCNLIVSTTHNNQAMNEAVRSVAREYLDGRELTEGLLNHIEVAIRAYDPCLSCATHAIGQMPLEVTLLGLDGELIDRVLKSGTGEFRRDLGAD
ncbi:MAG: Ni/Fe hydrogenase subunit alpha [Gammaproteobacteria bacterium]|uniref:Ni/Fe hydrogenase subunit alpha n=1 Tax=Rhodoferax sp. TaxID=50421 RepID=UPI0018403048|nr:Ni/Fe hydrogenase subunit alpha [Rhodoferax sp.]MBU3900519.1 Ni/Fe hydrogenase subunit alpha [Gammaproteobacteria bacterium]MBA3057576.1 Ni/Fe hydrogenase subunit alpha [Rhodoferax sp.]MBU3996424.1 Ni/Fe hydrogenase subunit alpha [Gammaproteobacteria bacterium]MBU4079964.1 Ni/Fe hydrogenase subunit alpha [Gammaproteobacteria bacterium]MBU4113420.1 Ni/Fe hydrogenase subunit alpha [Gammaproteobacteria bacterium]